MKICIVSTMYTGATLPFCKHLKEHGHEVDFFHFARNGQRGMENICYDAPVEGNKIIKLKKDNLIYKYLSPDINIFIAPYYVVRNRKYLIGFWNYYRNVRIIKKVAYQIEHSSYDVIYIIINEEHDYLLLKRLRKKGLTNIVVAYHEVLTGHIGNACLKNVVEKTIEYNYPIITYSENTKNVLQTLTNRKDINVIYFGPFEIYSLYETDAPIIKEEYILFIGSIQKYKGLSFLYKTIEEYKNKIASKVVVAGSGYDEVIAKMAVDEKYILINRFLSDGEFANLVKYAKCVICPYVSGSQSGITHVAMVYGTPVIATRVGAFPEFITDGENGYLIDYGNKEQLFHAIKLIEDNASPCHAIVPKKLQWPNIIDTIEPLLARIACVEKRSKHVNENDNVNENKV